jgi:hypothetical protein
MSTAESTDQRAISNDALRRLEEQIGELAAQIQAATFRLLELLWRYDQQGAWASGGFKTCAAWFSWFTGIDLGAAREKVRVARALPALPQTSDALRRGEISYSKVRAHVERVVRTYRKADAAAENKRAMRQLADRRLTTRYADDGALLIEARLPPEEGAKVLAALDAAADLLREESPTGEGCGKTSHSQRQADALVRLADGALAAGLPGRRAADTRQVVVHVEAAVLADLSEDGQCELESGVHVSAETARRFACDCSVVSVTDGDQLAVTDGHRAASTHGPSARPPAAGGSDAPSGLSAARCAGSCRPSSGAVSFQAAIISASSRRIIADIGLTAERRASRTLACSAPTTTRSFTRADIG